MKKLFPRSLIFLSLLSLGSCTITKRKYTGGFYVNWHSQTPKTRLLPSVKTIHIPVNKIQTSSVPEKTAVVQKAEIQKTAPSFKYPKQELEAIKNITNAIVSNTATLVNEATKEGSSASNAPDKRFLDRGLAGFEAALLDLIAFGLLVLFAHWGYTVFVLGCLLLIIGLTIYSLIYCFMGLNTNDKHRGLGFLGLLITIGVIVGVFLVGL